MEIVSENQKLFLGVGLFLLAYFVIAIMNAVGKLSTHVPITTILFFQNCVAMIIFLPFALRHRGRALKTKLWSVHVLRAISGTIYFCSVFFAVKFMPLVNAVLLANVTPFFIPLLLWLCFKKSIPLLRWPGIIIGLVGAILVLHPTMNILKQWAGFIALGGSLFSAITHLCVDKLESEDLPMGALFYYFSFSTLLTLPFFLYSGMLPTTYHEWSLLGSIGLLTGLSQLLITFAYLYSTPSRLTPFLYALFAFEIMIQWGVWHVLPSIQTLIGVGVICIGGFVSFKLNKN